MRAEATGQSDAFRYLFVTKPLIYVYIYVNVPPCPNSYKEYVSGINLLISEHERKQACSPKYQTYPSTSYLDHTSCPDIRPRVANREKREDSLWELAGCLNTNISRSF